MYYYNIEILLTEVPGHISICFSICGCQLRCKGCHSPFLWTEKNGQILTHKNFIDTLINYKGLASCVLFMGGEWYENELINFLTIAQKEGFKTYLYTGENDVNQSIKQHLNWIKTGKWIPELGGLNSPITNQKFIELQNNNILNHLFLNEQK